MTTHQLLSVDDEVHAHSAAQLRRALGPDVVRRSGDLIGLGDLDSDLSHFRHGAGVEGPLEGVGSDEKAGYGLPRW